MNKHVWREDARGSIDIFALEYDIHNGPRCVVCGRSACHHCEPGIYAEPCPGGDGWDMR